MTARTREPFRLCLNTATIRGQKLPLEKSVELVADAGWDGIEPWIDEIEDFESRGGSLDDLARRIRDLGLRVESAIGFARWIVDDEPERTRGLERARRDMDRVRRLGGTRIAAPPVGAHDGARIPLDVAAERYRRLLELGASIGVTPLLEVWGFSSTLSRLSEVLYAASASGRSDAALLLDVYHLHRGGSAFEGLALLNADALPVFHLNDYPATPERTQLKDADRVLPGDGIAPLTDILQTLSRGTEPTVLSLELFRKELWERDPAAVLREGLAKTRAAIARATR